MADLVKISELFAIEYGNQFDRNKLEYDPDGVNFVSRTSSNLGVDTQVRLDSEVAPYEEGLITVTLGGTYLLSAFVQPGPFYTGQNIKVLRPLEKMSFNEKVYYCIIISSNRFRYTSHGREANKTFDDILVPPFEAIPNWVNATDVAAPSNSAISSEVEEPNVVNWADYRLDKLFDIRKGVRLTKDQMSPGATPFVAAIDSNNGVRQHVNVEPNHEANTITVSYNGSVGEAFYQPTSFWASDDVNVLYPKFKMTPLIGLILCTMIRSESFRFNYGRKWNLDRMKDTEIRLPKRASGEPDWPRIEKYAATLPYSSGLAA